MKRLGSMFLVMVGFLSGIAFVYSCNGGGSSGSADVALLEARIEALETRLAYMVIDDTSTIEGLAPPHVIFRGANLHVENGLSHTDSMNGLGNLIVGYNEAGSGDSTMRTGSHNLVVGQSHRYANVGGLVAGYNNAITGSHASVSGGYYNRASGDYSSISGGGDNTASGTYSSISGGQSSMASGTYSSISGGVAGVASGDTASVSGGYQSTAGGDYSSVSGGAFNNATGNVSSVSGGLTRDAPGENDWAAGSLWQEE